jgi:hypothetical protein
MADNVSKGILRKIGVDPGFSSVKVAEVQGDDITSFLLPSTVGQGADTNSGLSLAGVGIRRRGAKPFQVQFGQYDYLTGPNVAQFTKPLNRMDFDRFTDSPELRASLYAALYKIVNGGGHDVALAVALPVSVLKDGNEANRVERAMKAWLVGNHYFSVNGVDVHLNIHSVRAKVPQPVASWMDWGMNSEGQWMKGADALKAPTLVVDQGFNTLDVLVVQNGQINHRHTGGGKLGMRRAAENLMNALDRRFRLTLDLMDANELIWKATKKQPAIVYLNGNPEDVSKMAKQAVKQLETDVLQFLEAVMENRQYRALLTGGGALSMSTRLMQMFPGATLLYEPVLANARGLAKLANRKGFFGD